MRSAAEGGRDVSEIAWDIYDYRVRSGEMVTPVIRELWLEPVGAALSYRPGQYVLLADGANAVPQRSYSVANAPRADGRISVLVTLVPGGPTSTWAHGLSAGDEVAVEGPFGTFTASSASTAPVLLLGAGSGLAPVRALAEALLDPSSPEGSAARPVTLFFSGRTPADAIGREWLQSLADEVAQFRYLVTCTRDRRAARHRRIPELLREEFGTLCGTEVFAAGPPGFVIGCEKAAAALGARSAQIHTEEFFADPMPWAGDLPPLPAAAAPTSEGIR